MFTTNKAVMPINTKDMMARSSVQQAKNAHAVKRMGRSINMRVKATKPIATPSNGLGSKFIEKQALDAYSPAKISDVPKAIFRSPVIRYPAMIPDNRNTQPPRDAGK